MRARRNTLIGFAVVALMALGLVATIDQPDTSASAGASPTTSATTTTTDPGPTEAEIDRLNRAILQNELDRQTWNTAVWVNTTNERLWIERQEQLAETERQAAREAEERIAPSVNTPSSGRCGGNLPPCCVMERESGGSLTAKNPTSSASGKWQFISSTWAGFGGYAEAYLAPESVQDAKARQLWAGGAGCGHWNAC